MVRLVGMQHIINWVDGKLYWNVEEIVSYEVDSPKQIKKLRKLMEEDFRIAHGINCYTFQEDNGPVEMYQYMRLDYPEHRKHRWVQVYGGWIANPEEVIHHWQNQCLLDQRTHVIKQLYGYNIGRFYGIDEEEALAWYARNRDFLLAS